MEQNFQNPFPIDYSEMSNENLIINIKRAQAMEKETHSARLWLDALHAEVNKRLEKMTMGELVEFGTLVNLHFRADNLPIRKKITYSPTGKKAGNFWAIFSRKNRWGSGQS